MWQKISLSILFFLGGAVFFHFVAHPIQQETLVHQTAFLGGLSNVSKSSAIIVNSQDDEDAQYEKKIHNDAPVKNTGAIVDEDDVHDQAYEARIQSLPKEQGAILQEEAFANQPQKEPTKLLESSTKIESPDKPVSVSLAKYQDTSSSSGAASKVLCPIDLSRKPSQRVVINEVAWSGTPASFLNEWIELRNTTDDNVNLFNWQLRDKKGEIIVNFPSQSLIAGQHYFLLERTDDTSVPGMSADLIYKGALNDSNEALYLFDSSCAIVDRVEANPSWQAGTASPQRKSMERTDDGSWQTYQGPAPDGITGVWGTPRAQNSAPIQLPQETKKPSYRIRDVVISEIAWMGDSRRASNEWFELFNNASSTIDLSDWSLEIYGAHSSTTIELSGTIAANNYFLAERTNDDSVQDIRADITYAGALDNGGDLLILKDPRGNEIDRVGGVDVPWYAGDNVSKKTMQRNDLMGEGTNPLNWFSAKATPKKMNEPDSVALSAPTASYSFHDVVINEIAWMGTKASFADEWLELYNATSTQVNLTGWKILFFSRASTTADFTLAFDALDTVNAHDFFLLERNATSTIATLDGKVYQGEKSQLLNSGGYLLLEDGNNNIIDIVDGLDGWKMGTKGVKGESAKRKSMERSEDFSSWYTFIGVAAMRGNEIITDATGEGILGTPGCPNSGQLNSCAA